MTNRLDILHPELCVEFSFVSLVVIASRVKASLLYFEAHYYSLHYPEQQICSENYYPKVS